MKVLPFLLLTSVATPLPAAACLPPWEEPERDGLDLVEVAGGRAKVVFENARVRVLEVNVAPGERTGVHRHGEHLVVFLAPVEGQNIGVDGRPVPVRFESGAVHWGDPITHDTVNTGAAATRNLIIELK
ncbi:hypothetical protein [Arenimonas composti]|uniref:Cupin 2 conserved barrel domain-containing protein n=1 Tax=Arenimonas composti TR7-09 = DSM 18010 TaxID=1121013 RepID=A0A091BW83_9GAMM|nr:hypothetical protein [Arenimonas composti]KFN48605.1 hypothetical protein P873_13990 [Arenimonas composti TR7-09 = DSM 18010]